MGYQRSGPHRFQSHLGGVLCGMGMVLEILSSGATPDAHASGSCTGSSTLQTCTFTGLAVSAPSNGKATTYPLQAVPATLNGTVTNVSISLTGITQANPSNIGGAELLLVAPNGAQLVTYAAGGDGFSAPPSSLIIDDAGSDPCTGAALAGAAHVQTSVCQANHKVPVSGGAGGFPNVFPNVLAPGTSCTHLACAGANPPSVTMNNTFSTVVNANGTWSLYLVNNGNSGLPGDTIYFTGWTLAVTTSGPAVVGVEKFEGTQAADSNAILGLIGALGLLGAATIGVLGWTLVRQPQ